MNEIAIIEKDGLGQAMLARRDDFIRMLGGPGEAERFIQEAYSAVNSNQFLRQCTPESLFGALYFAAQIGLPVGGPLQQFHLTPRFVWNPNAVDPRNPKQKGAKEWQVVPVVGYNGLITLAMNTGEYDAIEGKLVYSNDDFEPPYDDETGTHFKLRPATGDRGELIGVIGRALVKGSNRALIEWLDVDEIRDRMRPDKWEKTPWKTDEPAMVKKTGIRRVSKYTAKTRESWRFAQAIEGDSALITLDGDGELVVNHDEPASEDWASLVKEATDKKTLQELWQRLTASEGARAIDDARPLFAARYAELEVDTRTDQPSADELAAAAVGHETGELSEAEYERLANEEYAAAVARGEVHA